MTKSLATKNLQTISNGQVLIPKWAVVVGSFIFLGSAAVFTASIAISLSRNPNGLYNETCRSRNCEKTLGLKCINKICQCENKQFYLDSCRNLSSFNEPCNIDSNCLHNQLLQCGIQNKCDCSSENYWNFDLKKCSKKKTFSEVCDGDQCKSELKIFCDFTHRQCRCIDSKL